MRTAMNTHRQVFFHDRPTTRAHLRRVLRWNLRDLARIFTTHPVQDFQEFRQSYISQRSALLRFMLFSEHLRRLKVFTHNLVIVCNQVMCYLEMMVSSGVFNFLMESGDSKSHLFSILRPNPLLRQLSLRTS